MLLEQLVCMLARGRLSKPDLWCNGAQECGAIDAMWDGLEHVCRMHLQQTTNTTRAVSSLHTWLRVHAKQCERGLSCTRPLMRRRALAHLDDVADAIVVCVVLESEYTGLRVEWIGEP